MLGDPCSLMFHLIPNAVSLLLLRLFDSCRLAIAIVGELLVCLFVHGVAGHVVPGCLSFCFVGCLSACRWAGLFQRPCAFSWSLGHVQRFSFVVQFLI